MNIFCIEKNYFTQINAVSPAVIDNVLIFVKSGKCLLQQPSEFSYPHFAIELYGGCELVLHVSKDGKDIREDAAAAYFDAMTIGINFTAIDNSDELQDDEKGWEKAKAWDNSSVIGEWIPAEKINHKNDIDFCFYKNRLPAQLGNSAMMINNFDKIIAGISKRFSLKAGDIIFTGSPVSLIEMAKGDKLEAFFGDDSMLEFEIE
ncbi:MAG: fumarylacetoacetate hydrolase family protein [Bacteroidota bacterium]|nr:fumarylacetoacetate hydrolase family protein [Bacteroidota bacterium]